MMNAMNTSNNEYELQPFDVLCGRDKKCYNNIGNRRFRILINSNLPRYLRCSNRKERSRSPTSLTSRGSDLCGRLCDPIDSCRLASHTFFCIYDLPNLPFPFEPNQRQILLKKRKHNCYIF